MGQPLPHIPQLAGSLLMSTQELPHFVVPPVHESPQVLAEQTSPEAHTVRQSPQWAGSFVVLTQALPQSVVPPEHCNPHTPFEQT